MSNQTDTLSNTCEECGKSNDVKAVQFRDGWGKSANGYFPELHLLCKNHRTAWLGSWRYHK